MKLTKTLSLTLVAMAFFAVAGAAAKGKHFTNVVLYSDATLAGTHLASGSYDVQWQTHSPEATVTFSQKGKVIATAEGKLVDRGTKYESNGVVFDDSTEGTRAIRELRFLGSSEAIEFNQ